MWIGFLHAVLMGLALVPTLSWAQPGSERFFLQGDGRLQIKSARTGLEASVSLLTPEGALSDEALNRVDEVFGLPSSEKGKHISLRLLFILDHFSDLVAPGKTVVLESGYRSPEYNTGLRNAGGNVATTSLHMDGLAVDFRIDGVDGKKLWELIREKDCCGVGHYGGSVVHLDAGRPRFWEANTSKVGSGESEHNQRIMLTTDFDRYRMGETVRLSLASVSDFGFGIKPAALLVRVSQEESAAGTAQIDTRQSTDCIMIPDRETSHGIPLTLPPNLSEGRYRIRIDFCRRPFEQMPPSVLSNAIEVVKTSHR